MSSSGQPGVDSVGGSAVRWRSALRDRSAELLVIAAVALAGLTQLTLTKFKDVIPYSSAGFVFAIGLLGAAAFAQTRRARAQVVFSQAPQTDTALPPRIEIALLAAVFVLAVFFRFWHLLSFPPGLWSDEAINASDAIALIDGDHTRIWFDSVFGRSTLYLYLLAGSMKIFGYTIFAIRIVPALAGLAAVVAFYPLARHLVGSVPAVVATALFAVSSWAVTFSRVSWEASVQPVLEILAIYFIVRGIDRMSRVSFAFGGVALAAGLYGYIAFRMVPIFVALLLLYVAATQWRSLRSNAAGLLVFALAFLAAVAPLANFALHNQDRFLQRTRDVNVFREIDREGSYEPLRHNVHATLKMMNVRGDGNGRHNLPGAPMVDDVTAALFILGLGASVWSIGDWRRGSLVIWLGLSLIPGALTLRIENPSAIRAIGALPPLYLLVGLGVAAVYRPLAATRNGLILFGALATALVGGSTALNYDELFRQQAHAKDVYDGFTPVYAGVGELIASKAGSHRVYVSQKFYSFNAVRVLTHGKRYDPYIAGNDVVFPRGDQDVLLILDDNELAVLETLRRLYPNLQHDDHVDPFGRLEYASVTIPVTDIDASHQLTLTQLASGGEPVVSRAPLDREWTADDLASGPIAAAWEGYIWVTTSGAEVPVDIRVPGTDATLAVDGDPAPLLSADGGNASLGVLPIGEHHIRISALIARPGRVKMRLSMEGPSMVAGADASDALYQESTGSAGFQVGFRAGRDFSGDPVATGRVPFAVPMPGIANAAAVEYRGILDVPALGTYGFALDGTSSSQIFVDDELLVDNGGGHPRRRVEATIDLSPGPHAVSIQYIAGAGQLDWSLHLRAPSRDWALATGSEFRVPEGAFRTTPSVIIAPSAGAWPSSVLRLAGLDIPTGIAVAPGGTVLVGGDNKIVVIGADGAAQRTISVDVGRIDDLDVTPSGKIVVIDDAAGSLVLLDASGRIVKRFDKVFSSAFGVGVLGETAYVAAPAGGIVYGVPLPDGPVATLSITDPEAEGHPKQPSDVAVSTGGVFYIIDFERQNVVRSPDGATGRAFRGVGGTGTQVPHIAVYGSLVLLTDPVNQRIVVYDIAGKQRGAYLFPAGAGGTRPIGIAVAPDGTIYVADASGTVQRLKIEIPPATSADLPPPDGS